MNPSVAAKIIQRAWREYAWEKYISQPTTNCDFCKKTVNSPPSPLQVLCDDCYKYRETFEEEFDDCYCGSEITGYCDCPREVDAIRDHWKKFFKTR